MASDIKCNISFDSVSYSLSERREKERAIQMRIINGCLPVACYEQVRLYSEQDVLRMMEQYLGNITNRYEIQDIDWKDDNNIEQYPEASC